MSTQIPERIFVSASIADTFSQPFSKVPSACIEYIRAQPGTNSDAVQILESVCDLVADSAEVPCGNVTILPKLHEAIAILGRPIAQPGTGSRAEERSPVISEILSIAAEYRRQEASSRGVDTPGGVEHRGDFGNLILKWENIIRSRLPAELETERAEPLKPPQQCAAEQVVLVDTPRVQQLEADRDELVDALRDLHWLCAQFEDTNWYTGDTLYGRVTSMLVRFTEQGNCECNNGVSNKIQMSTLTDEQLRVKVAQAAGWKWLRLPAHADPFWLASPTESGTYLPETILKEPHPWNGQVVGGLRRFPDWPNDLDACAELRAGLSEEEQILYVNSICEQLTKSGRHSLFDMLDATARDHCLAFLGAKNIEV